MSDDSVSERVNEGSPGGRVYQCVCRRLPKMRGRGVRGAWSNGTWINMHAHSDQRARAARMRGGNHRSAKADRGRRENGDVRCGGARQATRLDDAGAADMIRDPIDRRDRPRTADRRRKRNPPSTRRGDCGCGGDPRAPTQGRHGRGERIMLHGIKQVVLVLVVTGPAQV